ncbi:MAG: glycosyltransferase family 2 protein [Solirubrobacterales bacterium]|nr:glycosyltransferase family 2 protein [Solirubrobacterales bacterium]
MMPSLSVVVPVFNERAEDLATTLTAVAEGLRRSPFADPEVLVVDDGSAVPISPRPLPGVRTRVVRQSNRGRFQARRRGIELATGEYVLLLDSRVRIDPAGLSWVAERVRAGEAAWNGHCRMANPDSPYARFWNVLTRCAFTDYLDDPRTTSFTLTEYDRFPKGTGHFLAPRQWLLDAVEQFDSRYQDSRFSSDDTHMLRSIAQRDRIHISPEFASLYRNREALMPFLRHAMHRGTTFYDGFARRGTRFFPIVIAAFPASLAGVALAVARPRAAGLALGGLSLGAIAFAARRRPLEEAAAFGFLVAPFAASFSAGLWRGGWLALRARAGP